MLPLGMSSGAVPLSEFPLPMVEIACDRCQRHGWYSKARLVAKYGPEIGLPDLRTRLTPDCPQRIGSAARACGASYPALRVARVRRRLSLR
jgi:hypothetical protein